MPWAAWTAHRAEAAETGSDGGARLDGDAAEAIACDAAMAPIVTGDVNAAALEDLVRLCTELGRLRRRSGDADAGTPAADTDPAREALEQAIIGTAVDLLSARAGWRASCAAGCWGRGWAGPARFWTSGMPSRSRRGIRNAVILRDRHCQWAGRCGQPAAACEVHHTTHKANGGKTSVQDCVLLCWFHHQIVIHQWGWTLILNPDGTTTAWNKDKTKVLHSHGPPARPG